MGIYLNPGNKSFWKSIRSEIYVDKSELIAYTNKCLNTRERFICVSRPRRFGKSMTLEMLAAYYSRGCNSSDLFKGLKIEGSDSFFEHLNKYNVIFLNMQRFLYRAKKQSITDYLEHVKVNTLSFQNDMQNFRTADDILTLLIHLGYLGYNSKTKEAFIPNKEIMGEFENAMSVGGWQEVMRVLKASEKLLEDTLALNEENVAIALDNAHTEISSILTYNDENSLACAIGLAYYSARKDYRLIRELPAGRGFADIVFLPLPSSGKPALVIELKSGKTARTAIQQIKERQYTRALEGYAGEILLIGINYDKHTKKHSCVIEKSTILQTLCDH